MSSYRGPNDPNFPFGCTVLPSDSGEAAAELMVDSDDPNTISGIGQPPFPLPGPPLLNHSENQTLNSFFDTALDATLPNTHSHQQIPPEAQWQLPGQYFGAETHFGPRSSIDPHHLQHAEDMNFDLSGHGMQQMMSQANFEQNIHQPHSIYADPTYNPGMFYSQLHNTAGAPAPLPHSWQHPNQQNQIPTNGLGRPRVQFGSDDRFQPDGFAAISPHDPDMNPMRHFMLDPASATNTAPNSAHNTQPPSPVLSRKRKFEDYHANEPPNGLDRLTNGYHHNQSALPVAASNPRRRRPSVKQERSPPTPESQPTPISSTRLQKRFIDSPEMEVDEDAEAESDNDTSRPPTSAPSPPPPWPASKARPPRIQPPEKPHPKARQRKNTMNSTTSNGNAPLKPKSKPPRPSSSHQTRTTLTAEQKKANHTNSEQRRRDLTAQAYAELFDLVPDLENMGKQSTMKRLEIVVQRVREVKEIVTALKARRDEMRTADGGWGWDDANGVDVAEHSHEHEHEHAGEVEEDDTVL